MIVYLASPYSAPTEQERILRFNEACRAAAKLMRDGLTVFCPISHSHPIAMHMPSKYSMDHEFWMRQDLPILVKCARMYVLRLSGWEQSKGVAKELEFAVNQGIPVIYIDPE